MWFRKQNEQLEVHIEKSQNKTKIKAVSKSYLALLYNRMTKERRERKSSNANTASLYRIHLPPPSDSSCPNIPSEYHTMIFYTTNPILINTTMPHHPTSQHLRFLPYPNKLYRHHLAAFIHHLHTFSSLRLSVKQFLPHPSIVPKPHSSSMTVSPI